MTELGPILSLPPEIHLTITEKLAFPENLKLKVTNCYFYNLIPHPTHKELLEAESSQYACDRNLFACMDCVRLLPASKFADNMRKAKKRKGGAKSHGRFCIECGLNPKAGTTRYTRGSLIVNLGNVQVICVSCCRLNKVKADDISIYCEDCQVRTGAL